MSTSKELEKKILQNIADISKENSKNYLLAKQIYNDTMALISELKASIDIKTSGDLLTRLKNSLKREYKKINDELRQVTKSSEILTLSNLGIKGKVHPISDLISLIVRTLSDIGFEYVRESDILVPTHINFTDLLVDSLHPSIKEVFSTGDNLILRSHTTTMLAKYSKMNLTGGFCCSGKVFRTDKDKTHLPEFHQVDGFMLTKDDSLSISYLRSVFFTIVNRINEKYGTHLVPVFKSSFFPFTFPSIEVYLKNRGDDKDVEVAGCGIIHNKIGNGIAFGIGIERICGLITGESNMVNIGKWF